MVLSEIEIIYSGLNTKTNIMKKLTILFVFVLFAMGCADNMDTVPQPIEPDTTIDANLDAPKSSTPEEEEDKPIRPRLPKTNG
ncbi:hypothetical protein AWW67_01915 [Roseivirga seohaensis]|uniref:Uncharacterized protein n=2 Tax=Roseivirga seohaensis TaxID=1914963 RepID=A0A150Y1G0_9BACT|nr:hypothetical protein AWW67_01915 [Roseivirga seohaensis]